MVHLVLNLFSYIVQLELLILAAIYTRKPIKYYDYWKYGDSIMTGRPIYQTNYSIGIDKNSEKITSIVLDNYAIVSKKCSVTGLTGVGLSLDTFKDFKGFTYGNRLSFIENNILPVGWQRAITEAESYAFSSCILF